MPKAETVIVEQPYITDLKGHIYEVDPSYTDLKSIQQTNCPIYKPCMTEEEWQHKEDYIIGYYDTRQQGHNLEISNIRLDESKIKELIPELIVGQVFGLSLKSA